MHAMSRFDNHDARVKAAFGCISAANPHDLTGKAAGAEGCRRLVLQAFWPISLRKCLILHHSFRLEKQAASLIEQLFLVSSIQNGVSSKT